MKLNFVVIARKQIEFLTGWSVHQNFILRQINLMSPMPIL